MKRLSLLAEVAAQHDTGSGIEITFKNVRHRSDGTPYDQEIKLKVTPVAAESYAVGRTVEIMIPSGSVVTA